jgi:hypothetical protein
MGSISIREHIRWLPGTASEPTSTLVLTTPKRRFVDLRILLPNFDEPSPDELDGIIPASPWPSIHWLTELLETIPLGRLDWAIAGSSSSSLVDANNGQQVTHSVWKHWIDSRTTEPQSVLDEGDMFPQPDGTTLEKGRMVNPDTGLETDYEELWRDLEPVPATDSEDGSVERSLCAVLQLHDETRGQRGLVVRLGQYCQGLLRDGKRVTAERWEWRSKKGWSRLVKIGDGISGCSTAVFDSGELKLGQEIKFGEQVWTVVELSHD